MAPITQSAWICALYINPGRIEKQFKYLPLKDIQKPHTTYSPIVFMLQFCIKLKTTTSFDCYFSGQLKNKSFIKVDPQRNSIFRTLIDSPVFPKNLRKHKLQKKNKINTMSFGSVANPLVLRLCFCAA